MNKSGGNYKHPANAYSGLFTLQYAHYASITEDIHIGSNLTIVKKELLLNVRDDNHNSTVQQILNHFKSLNYIKFGFPLQTFKLDGDQQTNNNDIARQCFDCLAFLQFTNPKQRFGELFIDINYKMNQVDCGMYFKMITGTIK